MDKHGQAIGGIKSQQRILRERIDSVQRQADLLAFRITLLFVIFGAFVATVTIGLLLK